MCSLKTKRGFVLLLWFVFNNDIYFEFQITLKESIIFLCLLRMVVPVREPMC